MRAKSPVDNQRLLNSGLGRAISVAATEIVGDRCESPALLSPKICKTDRIQFSRLITGILLAAVISVRFAATEFRLVWRTVCEEGNDEELGRTIRQVDSFAVNGILNTSRWTRV